MHDRHDYLIICDSPKQAHDLFRRVVDKCLEDKIVIERASQCTYTIHFVDLTLRFVSQHRACDALIGFRGLIRNGWEFELFLDNDELYKFLEAFYSIKNP